MSINHTFQGFTNTTGQSYGTVDIVICGIFFRLCNEYRHESWNSPETQISLNTSSNTYDDSSGKSDTECHQAQLLYHELYLKMFLGHVK